MPKPPDLTRFDDAYRNAPSGCECGDPGCPVPKWLPEEVSVELYPPNQTVMALRLDGYPTHLWTVNGGKA